jgi:hypothetical protein
VSPGANDSFVIGKGDAVVCMYTNTRQHGSIELTKLWSGTKGDVTLDVGTSEGGSDTATETLTGADGTTGVTTVDTGTYYVSESVTTAGDYDSSLACVNNEANPATAVTPGANGDVTVTKGDVIVCTYTNTRQHGSIELAKAWSGTKGGVTLNVGTSMGGSDTATKVLTKTDGTTGVTTVDTGTYYVSELVTNAGDYDSSLVCTKNGHEASPGANNSFVIGKGDAVVCTFRNTRRQGSIELKKEWSGTKGDVTLKIGTSEGASDTATKTLTGADGTTGVTTVDTGTYYLSESSVPGYTASLGCTNKGNVVSPGANADVTLATGDVIVCTFNNSLNTGTIRVVELVDGVQQSNWTVGATAPAGPATISPSSVSTTADFALSKVVAAGSTTTLSQVTQAGFTAGSVSCTGPGPTQNGSTGSVAVTVKPGEAWTCTFTTSANSEPFAVAKDFSDDNPADVSVSLVCSPGSVTGVDRTASEADPANFLVNGFGTKAGTSCTATETAVPSGYTSSRTCSATLAAGECTITNSLDTAPFRVAVAFSDKNPAGVSVSVVCTGAPGGTVAGLDPTASEADPANFVVNGFGTRAGTTCTATESSVPAGYTSSGTCSATLAVGACTIINTAEVEVPGVVPVQVRGAVAVRLISAVRRRALVAGEFVRLTGRAPADCGPILRVDGETTGPVTTARDGSFDLRVGTRDLATGRHVAEVFCSRRDATLLRKTFWIAAPISSSNVLVVVLAALLVLFALGWVGLRTIAGSAAATQNARINGSSG